MPYAELHARSYFSFLDAASAPEDLVQQVIDRLAKIDEIELETLPGITENVRFRMPAKLADPVE